MPAKTDGQKEIKYTELHVDGALESTFRDEDKTQLQMASRTSVNFTVTY